MGSGAAMSWDTIFSMLEDEDETEESKRDREWDKYMKDRERLTFIGGHLCSPIVEEDSEFLLSTPLEVMKGCKRHTVLKKKLIKEFPECSLIADKVRDPIGYLQDWTRQQVIKDTRSDFSLCLASLDNFVLHKMNYMIPYCNSKEEVDFCLQHTRGEVADCKRALQNLSGRYEEMRQSEVIKDAIAFSELPDGQMIRFKDLWAEQDICVLRAQSEGDLIFSTNLLLCSLDKVQCKFGLEAYWIISDTLKKYPNKSLYTTGTRLMRVFESMRKVMGQDFFSLMAGYESLIVGWAVAAHHDLGCRDLFRSEAEASLSLMKKYKLQHLFSSILPPDRDFNTVLMHLELTGIVKTFGYPTLKADRMLDQIFEYGTKNKFEINHTLLRRVEGVMRREFCLNYYKKHTRYPRILYHPQSLKNLGRNKPMSDHSNKLYDDWASVIFAKTIEFDYVPDQADMIKDSAAAVNRSAWASMYDGCAFRKRYGKAPPRRRKRIYPTRTVEAYLEGGEDEIRKLITAQDEGTFKLEDWICVECQKECELKGTCGRAFTKQTPPRRLIQVTMEHNVADGIFPYVPEQSMTDSEIKNTQKILTQVKSMQRSSHFMSLDLKKWCLNWRHEVVEMTGRMYDELFGLKSLFQNCHLFFVGCLVLSNNRLTPPDFDAAGEPVEGPVCCRSFIGAMEGLHQKFWTHPTGALIRYVMEMSNMNGDIMGQGDNQVIVLHFPKDDENAGEKRDAFLKSLSSAFQGINHELKRQETWFSQSLHEYSKNRFYEGVSVSYSTKKASKLIPDSNDGLFSTSSSMSTINTMTEGIARADYKPDAAFMVNQFLQTSFLLRKQIISKDCNKDTLRALLNWPLDFGGLPVSSYLEHTLRGNDDKITQWWGILNTAKELGLPVVKEMERLWETRPARPAASAKERARLYEDIYCLLVKVPPSCEARMKSLIAQYLTNPRFVKNPVIRKLYSTDCSVTYDSLIEAIDLIRPNFLPASHELLASSNAGRLLQLQGKLTSSKTLQRIVQLHERISLIDLIKKKNDEFRVYVQNRIRYSKFNFRDQIGLCPSEVARDLRQKSWGIETIDVTKAPLCHQIKVKPVDLCTDAELESGISVRLSGEMVQSPRQCYLTYGPAKNYIGSKTKSKIKKSTINIVEKSGFVKNLQKIGLIRSWFTKIGDQNMVDLCTLLMEEKRALITEMPEGLNDLGELCSTVTSGNILHRFKSSVEHEAAMLNGLPSVTGHFEYSSNSMKNLTAGGVDLEIFYQYIMVGVTAGLSMYTNITGVAHNSYMVLFPCESCTRVIPDINITMSSIPSKLKTQPIPGHLRPTTVTVDLDPSDARFLMALSVGYNIARNIDENFRVHHTQGTNSLTAMDYKKDVVSLNDLRSLPLDVVLDVALSTSQHGNRLYWSRESLLVAHSEDRSFMYFSECILESGLVPKLIDTLGIRVTEHSAVTTSHGLASFLSRHSGQYMEKNGKKVIANSTKYVFQDSSPYLIDNILRFSCLWKSKHREITREQRVIILNELATSKNLGLVAKMMKVPLQVVKIDMPDMITLWRTINKNFSSDLSFRPLVYPIPDCPSESYDYLGVGSLHSGRMLASQGTLTYTIPQLSFFARSVGVISTAASKFAEVLFIFGLIRHFQNKKGVLFCLAEGSGGTFVSLLTLFPQFRGLYNTWMRADIANRDRVNDYSVPAATALLMDPDKIIRPNILITGETDITQPSFLLKLTDSTREYRPDLVTIDAESPEGSREGGSNIQFLQTTVVTVLESFTTTIILKMFLQQETHKIASSILERYKSKVLWYFCKPLSSNPVGREVYLVIIPRDIPRPNNEQVLRDLEDSVLSFVPSTPAMSASMIKDHIIASKNLSEILMNMFPPELRIRNKYSDFLPQMGCHLFCPKFFDNLLEIFDRIHATNNDFCVHLAIRMKGTNGTLLALAHEIIFLMMWHSRGNRTSIVDILTSMCALELPSDLSVVRANLKAICPFIRTRTTPLGLWRTWSDARMYLSDQAQGNWACSHSIQQRYYVYDADRKINGEKMLSLYLWQELKLRGMVTGDTFEKMRISPERRLLGHIESSAIAVPIDKVTMEKAREPDVEETLYIDN